MLNKEDKEAIKETIKYLARAIHDLPQASVSAMPLYMFNDLYTTKTGATARALEALALLDKEQEQENHSDPDAHIEDDEEYLKAKQEQKPICQTCFNDRKIMIYPSAGFAYQGPPYKIKCPACRPRRDCTSETALSTPITGAGNQELADCHLFMGWLHATQERAFTDEDDRTRQAFLDALKYGRAHPLLSKQAQEGGERCQSCGTTYATVYRLNDDHLWARITGRENGGGLLCPSCCDRLAREAGVELNWTASPAPTPETK